MTDLNEAAEEAIEDAQNLVEDRGYQAVLTLVIDQDGSIRTTVAGEDKVKTNALKWWAENVIDPGLTTIPFATIFGWGNDGNPVKLDSIQLEDVKDIPFRDIDVAYEVIENANQQPDEGNT